MPHPTKPAAHAFAAIVATLVVVAAPLAAAARESSAASRLIEPAESLEGNFLSAYIAGAARDTGAAATFYREALKADPRNPELLERAFVSFLADGAMPEAFRAAERLAARDPSNSLAQLALGVKAFKAKQYATARTHFANSGRGRSADLTASLLTAWAYAGSNDGKRGLDSADRLRGERSYTTFRDYHAGLLAELAGNLPEAERRLKSAYESDRKTLRIVDAYARIEARRGRPDVALAAYQAFDAVLPRHPMTRAAMADLRAEKPLSPLVTSAQEGAAEVLYGLGSAGTSPGDELPALVYLRLALYLQPDHPLALVSLSEIFERLKRFEQANQELDRVSPGSPIRLSADIQIALNLEQLGRSEQAMQHLETLMKRNPDDVEVLTAMGTVLRSRKRFAEAAEVYTRAAERIGKPDRTNWTLFYYRGSAYERSKQWDKAEADLKLALELVPEEQNYGRAQVLNYLGYSWVDAGLNIDEAFKMLKRAVELSPRDGMIIDSLGWAYYRLGRYDDAVRELERAVEIKPGDPVVNDHLGDAYWQVGRRIEAGFQWRHAKDANPEPEDLAKILIKIEKGLDGVQPSAEQRTGEPAGQQGPRNGG